MDAQEDSVPTGGGEAGGSCSFRFDFTQVDGQSHAWDDGDDVWECPHEATVDGLCPFHAPPEETDNEAVVRALVQAVDDHEAGARSRASKQFVGARFDDFDLEFARLDSSDNYPVDLRHCHVEGELDCSHAVFTEPVDVRGLTVEGAASFVDARFFHDVWMDGASFGGDLDCYDVQFDDDAHMANVTVAGHAEFEDALFHEELDLTDATFESGLHAFDATFGDEADLSGARFHGRVCVEEAEFEDDCRLTGSVADGTLSFAGATFRAGLYVDDLTGAGGRVDLGEAAVHGGELAYECGERVFDLTRATVGDVDLAAREGRAFDGLHVEETSFVGFDFGRYIDDLASSDWRIHGSPFVGAGSTDSDEPGTEENTYVNAKNGAKATGNDRVAAEFFIREMQARRAGHRQRILDGDLPLRRRWGAAVHLVGNVALGVVTGYGERPSRVVGFSVAVVFLFAVLFALAMGSAPYDTPVGYLVVSATAFVTLVLGGGEAITDPWVRLLAEVEGFTGAFLIALFVFTLTRSINR
jgi:hypothetical protein